MGAVKVTVKNYRCFSDSRPAVIEIGDGFTAFVGPNNSGKSSLLKLFFELRDVWRRISASGNFLKLLNGETENFHVNGVLDQAEVFCDNNTRSLQIDIDLTSSFSSAPDDSTITKLTLSAARSSPQVWSCNCYYGKSFRDVRRLSNSGRFTQLDPQTRTATNGHFNLKFDVLFEIMESLTQSIYIGPFRNAINEGSGQYFDLAIGTSFISTWNQWKTGAAKAQNLAISQVTDSIRHIFEFPRLEINASEQLKTLQITIGDKPYKLPELGAGLAQFIIVLANAMIRRPSFVFIDEPELNLHPSLQIDFLTSLASYARSGIVFATHSVGLARATAERIYAFQKQGDSVVVRPFEQTTNYVEFLGEMSFSSFKELGCERVLLVEGVTDVRTVQQFLRKLQKDHRIVVIPLGGDSLIRAGTEMELADLGRLGAQVSMMLDREGPEPNVVAKRQAFADMAKLMRFNVCITERRAIENYFSDRAVKVVKGEKYRALGEQERLSAAEYGWSKAENWQIAREMDFEEIRDTDIGRFLESL